MAQATPSTVDGADPAARVDGWVSHARRLLPIQNPLWAFLHNNILQEYEALPFDDAVHEAAALYRARVYESEAFYRQELGRGRIARSCLDAVLREALPALDGDRVARFLDDERLGDTRPGKRLVPGPAADHLVRYSVRDRPLLDLLVPLVSTFLDQQMAAWANPWRDGDFWRFFVDAAAHGPAFGLPWSQALRARLRTHEGRSVDAVIAHEVGCYADDTRAADYVLQTLFILKGWSGMIARLEADPEVAPVGAPRIDLKNWLAALLVAVHALEVWLQDHDLDPPNPDPVAWTTVGLGRLALWHDAYERSFAVALLRRLERHATTSTTRPASTTARSARQAIVCMDDRNESFRRALESTDVDVDTIGGLGFFGVDMRYRALGAHKPTRQCPPVVTPTRTINEQPSDATGAALVRFQHLQESASMLLFHQSRALVRGFAVSLGLGLTSFFPLVVQTLFPSALARARRTIRDITRPEAHAHIVLDGDGGYDVDARADIVLHTLRTAGLRGVVGTGGDEVGTPLSPLVAIVGHQSTTTNNPFRQAYGCGACSGNSGRPNARAFVQMANDVDVRAAVAARGFAIPDDTLFVAVLHDTTADTIELLDREALPPRRLADVDDLVSRLGRAARHQARERARRLFGAPRLRGNDARSDNRAAAHVLQRAHDLAQPRPEWGHNRVAACIVGRRHSTRGLDLDRRAFLVSYDPATDADGSRLRDAVLGAVPVAVNIGLDYYFSRVDPDGFGAGSKLPLNVVSLLGVITGSKSDLRIGLARQMVELHEPMRMLVVIEARLAHLQALIDGHERMRRLVHGRWLRLVRRDPDDGALTVWRDGAFVPFLEALGGEEVDDVAAARHFDPAFDRLAGEAA